MDQKSVKVLMEEAYFRLLTKQHYLDISVSDIVKEAGVARASFYRNFSSSADIMEDILNRFYNTVIKEVLPYFIANRDNAWRMFAYSLFCELSNGDILTFRPLPENLEYILQQIKKKFDFSYFVEQTDINEKYSPAINIAIIFACATVWLNTGMKESAEELTDYVCKIIHTNKQKLILQVEEQNKGMLK